jgi:hypothetical protein
MSTTVSHSGNSVSSITCRGPYVDNSERPDERLPGDSIARTIPNATYIGVNDEEFQKKADQDKIERFEKYELLNRGTHNGKWRDQTLERETNDWYLCRCLTSQMGLSESQRLQTWKHFRRLDMRTFRDLEPEEANGLYETPPDDPPVTAKQTLVVFCIGALVYNDGLSNDDWKYYPGTELKPKADRYKGIEAKFRAENTDLVDRHERIKQCREDLACSDNHLVKCFEQVRSKISL